jgi:MFS family permease
MSHGVLSQSPRPPFRIRSRTFASLVDNANYRCYFAGHGVSLIGSWLQSAVVSWLVFELTRSERWLGLVEAAGVLPGVLFGLWAGAIADRLPPRGMVLAMQMGQMGCALALGCLVGTGLVEIWHLLILLALARVFVTFEMPSRQVLLYDLVGRDRLLNAIALNAGLFNASRVVGPALAGVCLAAFGPTVPFFLNAVSFLAAIGTLSMIPVTPRPQAARPRDLLGGLAYLGRNRRLATLFVLMMFFGVVGMGYMALVPAYAQKVVGAREIGYSVLVSCGGLGATIGALFVASLGGLARRERLVLGGMTLFSVALATAGWLPSVGRQALGSAGALASGAFCLILAGCGAVVFYSSTQTLIQSTVPDHLRGRVMGVWMIAFSGSVPLGSLWAGELAQRQGVAMVMLVSAVVCTVVAAGLGMSGLLYPSDSEQLAEGVDPGEPQGANTNAP